jgi:hypothetical protein
MIWGDAWIDDPSAGPPAAPELPIGVEFRCVRVDDMLDVTMMRWRALVGTQWPEEALRMRLADAWIAMLLVGGGDPVATCVLRPRSGVWLLETFVARPKGLGYGRHVISCAVPWIWARGCRSLVYTWELGLLGLASAWWRGWLRTAVLREWGWVLRGNEQREGGGDQLPILIRDPATGAYAVVSDSGLRDGWGYVLMTAGVMDWPAVFKKGGWAALWYRGAASPASAGASGWQWTGEAVVVGVIGVVPANLDALIRLSPEIAHS